MAITAIISGETYTGATLAEIIDREYGADANPARTSDPNSPFWGEVIRRVDHSSFEILGRIISVDGEEETLDVGATTRDLGDVAVHLADLDSRRAQLVKSRDKMIRQLLLAGATSKSIQDITGLSRSQIVNIRKA